MKKFLSGVANVIGVLLMLTVVAGVVLYREGYYDFNFIDRDKLITSEAQQTTAADDSASTGDYTSPARSSDNLSNITDKTGIDMAASTETSAPAAADTTAASTTAQTVSSAAEKQNTFASLTASIPTVSSLRGQGYSLTDTDYSKSTHRLALGSLSVNAKKKLTLRTVNNTIVSYATLSAVSSVVTSAREVLTPYMGWLLYDDGSTMSLLAAAGNLAMTQFDSVQPAYMRDVYGHPLFRLNGSLYYVGSEDKYVMYQSSYDSSFAPGLKIDEPAGYGASNCGLYLYYVDADGTYVANQNAIDQATSLGNPAPEADVVSETQRLYGYMKADGTIAITAQYLYAFNFSSNGLACVADRDRHMKIINTAGQTVMDPGGKILYLPELNRRPVVEYYMLPFTDGEENLGSYYFDHGYIRVNRVYLDYYKRSIVVSSKDLLLDASGNEFNYPQGYNLVYYSDGVLTLEKNGCYGCLDLTGKWIAQPIYTYITPFKEGLAVIGFADGKKAMIDTSGNIVLPFAYDYISEMSSGVCTAYESNAGWMVYQKMAIIKSAS